MADNRDRFGPHRSSEDLENDRNKMLEKEKIYPIQTKNHFSKSAIVFTV